eukprot:Clim_evm31s230 gene=Clim_evmTU31s230
MSDNEKQPVRKAPRFVVTSHADVAEDETANNATPTDSNESVQQPAETHTEENRDHVRSLVDLHSQGRHGNTLDTNEEEQNEQQNQLSLRSFKDFIAGIGKRGNSSKSPLAQGASQGDSDYEDQNQSTVRSIREYLDKVRKITRREKEGGKLPRGDTQTQASLLRLGELLRDQQGNVDTSEYYERLEDLSRRDMWESADVTVAWDDLSIVVEEREREVLGEVGDTFHNIKHSIKKTYRHCKEGMGYEEPRGRRGQLERSLVSGLEGYAKAGQMVLVLGPPGSGCTTLLQALAGKHSAFKRIEGAIYYNGEKNEFDKYRPRIIHVAEEDVHLPALTVEETLRLAAEMRTPLNMPNRQQRIQLTIDNALRMLGLSHVRNTPVGDDLLRGVSGGEKRRVSIGEAMVTGAKVLVMDGYTNGLDSAAALDIVRTLKLIARITGLTVILTQYQARKEIYEEFDNVLVLKEGKQVFFGPPKAAVPYFGTLGLKVPARRTVPDFLSTIGLDITAIRDRSAKDYQKAHYRTMVTMSQPNTPGSPGIGLGANGDIETGDINGGRRRPSLHSQGSVMSFSEMNENFDVDKGAVMQLRNGMVANADTLRKAYMKSDLHKRVRKVLDDRSQLVAELPECQCFDAKKGFESQYAVTFWHQLKLLIWRQSTLIRKDPRPIYRRLFRMLIVAILLALSFLNVPDNAVGAFSRAGLFFFALSYVALLSFGFIPVLMNRRAVYYKHSDASFYGPGAYVAAVTIEDIPWTVLETGLFAFIVYFLVGFRTNAAAFFYFWLAFWATDVALSGYIRMWAVGVGYTPYAQLGAGSTILLFALFAGFLIPRLSIPDWLIWLYWSSPLRYSFTGLLLNEFSGLGLGCDESELVPPASAVADLGGNVNTDPALQACPIPGNGDGLEFIRERFDVVEEAGLRWLYLFVLLAYATIFALISTVLLGKLRFGNAYESLVVFKRRHAGAAYVSEGNSSKAKAAAAAAIEDNEHSNSGEYSDDGAPKQPGKVNLTGPESDEVSDNTTTVLKTNQVGDLKLPPVYFYWRNLVYEVDIPVPKDAPSDYNNKKRLLDNVWGYVEPGTVTALMGSSGAGKSTLLDVLAKRKTGGHISGDIMVNGMPQDDNFHRLIGYVEQQDIHLPRFSVREALSYAARLRLPASVTDEEREEIIYDTMVTLELLDVEDAIIGGADIGIGLPLATRKRVTMGVELVAKPSIVFLDEPTSGLDTKAALIVMRTIRRIADSGRACIATIHQPSTEIFEMFDNLLLMQRGGQMVYFGPLGNESTLLIKYLEGNGAEAPASDENPADYMLKVIGAGVGSRMEQNWHHTWLDSEDNSALRTRLRGRSHQTRVKHQYSDSNDPEKAGGDAIDGKTDAVAAYPPQEATPVSFENRFAVSQSVQVRTEVGRQLNRHVRSPAYNTSRFLQAIVIALIVGLTFLNLTSNQADLRNRVAVNYYIIIVGGVTILAVMSPLTAARAVFYRERASGYYNDFTHFVGVFVSELPFAIGAALVFSPILYFLVGFQDQLDSDGRAGAFFAWLLFFVVFQITITAFGQSVAAWSPTLLDGQNLAPAIFSAFNLFAGFLLIQPRIPDYFIWLYWMNPYRMALSSLSVLVLRDGSFTCDESELVIFEAPPTGTCEDYNDIVYGTDTTLTNYETFNATACSYCEYVDGEQYLDDNGIREDLLWPNLVTLFAWIFIFGTITYCGIRYARHGTR